MNIEDLTKTQLLLLTILVNFVTSIATGVLTVSLLDQAPPTVIQTVNRIVDHTIEQVTTEVPVIRNVPVEAPSTEDLLTSAIAKTGSWSVRIYRAGGSEAVGRGFFHAPSRSVITTTGFPGTMEAEFSSGSRMTIRSVETVGSLERYEFDGAEILPQNALPRFASFQNLKQGQTAIALLADRSAVTGIITLVGTDEIRTDLPGVLPGEPVVNISGEVIGLSLSEGRVMSAEKLTALIAP